MSFLYFIPKAIGTPIQHRDELLSIGLTHVEPDAGDSNYVTSGPGGQGGAIWSPRLADGQTAGSPPIFSPSTQKWRKHPSGKYWVGMFIDRPKPTPDDLLRPTAKRLSGKAVTLLDGNAWTVPVCVPAEFETQTGSALPTKYDLDEQGKLVEDVRDDYRSLADRCYEFFEHYVGWQKLPPEGPQRNELFHARVQLAAELLSLNYKIAAFEAIAMLGLFGNTVFGLVLRAAIEADEIDAEIKLRQKKAQAGDGSDTASGSTAAAPAR